MHPVHIQRQNIQIADGLDIVDYGRENLWVTNLIDYNYNFTQLSVQYDQKCDQIL